MNPKSLAEITRRIQTLANSSTEESVQELDFYTGVFNQIQDAFMPGAIQNIRPISLGTCPVEKAIKFAKPLGMNIVTGQSGTLYLSWSKGLDIKD